MSLDRLSNRGEEFKSLLCDDCSALILLEQRRIGISDGRKPTMRQKVQMMNVGRRIGRNCKECREALRRAV